MKSTYRTPLKWSLKAFIAIGALGFFNFPIQAMENEAIPPAQAVAEETTREEAYTAWAQEQVRACIVAAVQAAMPSAHAEDVQRVIQAAWNMVQNGAPEAQPLEGLMDPSRNIRAMTIWHHNNRELPANFTWWTFDHDQALKAMIDRVLPQNPVPPSDNPAEDGAGGSQEVFAVPTQITLHQEPPCQGPVVTYQAKKSSGDGINHIQIRILESLKALIEVLPSQMDEEKGLIKALLDPSKEKDRAAIEAVDEELLIDRAQHFFSAIRDAVEIIQADPSLAGNPGALHIVQVEWAMRLALRALRPYLHRPALLACLLDNLGIQANFEEDACGISDITSWFKWVKEQIVQRLGDSVWRIVWLLYTVECDREMHTGPQAHLDVNTLTYIVSFFGIQIISRLTHSLHTYFGCTHHYNHQLFLNDSPSSEFNNFIEKKLIPLIWQRMKFGSESLDDLEWFNYEGDDYAGEWLAHCLVQLTGPELNPNFATQRDFLTELNLGLIEMALVVASIDELNYVFNDHRYNYLTENSVEQRLDVRKKFCHNCRLSEGFYNENLPFNYLILLHEFKFLHILFLSNLNTPYEVSVCVAGCTQILELLFSFDIKRYHFNEAFTSSRFLAQLSLDYIKRVNAILDLDEHQSERIRALDLLIFSASEEVMNFLISKKLDESKKGQRLMLVLYRLIESIEAAHALWEDMDIEEEFFKQRLRRLIGLICASMPNEEIAGWHKPKSGRTVLHPLLYELRWVLKNKPYGDSILPYLIICLELMIEYGICVGMQDVMDNEGKTPLGLIQGILHELTPEDSEISMLLNLLVPVTIEYHTLPNPLDLLPTDDEDHEPPAKKHKPNE